MKSGLLPPLGRAVVAWFVVATSARDVRSQPSPPTGVAVPASAYTADELDQLLGPIALYPDPLVALILPASTAPDNLVAAAGYLAAKGAPSDVGSQPWSESVKALAHYPTVVEWMAQNLTWVQAMGTAFATQPAAVMASIQRLRRRARELGNLGSTPQQQVVEEDDLIEILPTDPGVIYVPWYDSTGVFATAATPGGDAALSFGEPFQTGFWLTYGFDWQRRSLWIGRFYRDGQGWQRPSFFSPGVHPWHPPGAVLSGPGQAPPAAGVIIRPSLPPGAPPEQSGRWTGFSPRPAPDPAALPSGQEPLYAGAAPAVTAEQRRAMEERLERPKAGNPAGAPPPPAARPPPHPPRPAPPPAPPSADPHDQH